MFSKTTFIGIASYFLMLALQSAAAADYRSCVWKGLSYSHGAQNALRQTCVDGVWRG